MKQIKVVYKFEVGEMNWVYMKKSRCKTQRACDIFHRWVYVEKWCFDTLEIEKARVYRREKFPCSQKALKNGDVRVPA